jgi:hypothetical protein
MSSPKWLDDAQLGSGRDGPLQTKLARSADAAEMVSHSFEGDRAMLYLTSFLASGSLMINRGDCLEKTHDGVEMGYQGCCAVVEGSTSSDLYVASTI